MIMRLKNREIKDQETLRELIDDCVVVRIGAMDKEGMFIVPVNYGYEWEDIKDSAPSLKLYFHSASQGRKADAFSREPVVALELDREGGVIRGTYTCSYSFAYQSVMGTGKIRKLTEAVEKLHGFEKIMEHLAPEAKHTFDEGLLKAADVYCIDVLSFTGKERKPKETGQSENV